MLRLKAAKNPAAKPPSPRVWSPLRRRLHLHHVGAELGEHQPGRRAHHGVAELENLQPGQGRSRHQAALRRNASRLPAWISSLGSWWPTISSAMRPTSISLSRSTPVLDAHLLAQQHQLLGADVAGRALLAGERAAAQAADGGIEAAHAHAQAGMRVGDGQAARVVQVQGELHVRPARAHLAEHALDARRRRPAHGVGQREQRDLGAGLGGDRQPVLERADHLRRARCRPGSCSRRPPSRRCGRPARRVERCRRGLLAHRLEVLGVAAVEVLAREAFRRGQRDRRR